jgi:hypothetical protein
MSNRKITKVAVLGSGVMGSRIACHFANIGVQVLLLDIAPKELNEEEKKKGLSLDHPSVKNRIVNSSLQSALKSNPSPIYRQSFSKRIITGNFFDNMKDIAQCDWVIEVVVENIDIKKKIFDEVNGFSSQRMVSDSEMWHKLASKYKVLLMPEGLVWNREHSLQEVKSSFQFLVDYEKIMDLPSTKVIRLKTIPDKINLSKNPYLTSESKVKNIEVPTRNYTDYKIVDQTYDVQTLPTKPLGKYKVSYIGK